MGFAVFKTVAGQLALSWVGSTPTRPRQLGPGDNGAPLRDLDGDNGLRGGRYHRWASSENGNCAWRADGGIILAGNGCRAGWREDMYTATDDGSPRKLEELEQSEGELLSLEPCLSLSSRPILRCCCLQ